MTLNGVLTRPPTRAISAVAELLVQFVNCLLCGSPTPQVTWTRIGSGPSRYRVTREGHGTEIEFTNVQYDDAGTYRCSATNTGGPPTLYEDLVLVVECT